MLSHLRFPKFLLNSRSPLVTATSSLLSWHPFYRRYGANLPNSLAKIHLLRLSLLSLWYLCQISVRTAPRFSRAPGIGCTSLVGSPSRFDKVLTITVLPSLNALGYGDGRTQTSRMRPLLWAGTGILTRFPFDRSG